MASLDGVVDEAVVVDTGSTDRSTDVARSFGARVFTRPWDGDFSRARNAGLEEAKGRWILYIDADERLAPVERADVTALLDGAEEVAFRVLLRPYVGWTAYREYRLWRSDPRIRFHGIIHEKVMPAIQEVAATDRRRISDCALELDHFGYEGDQTGKHLRNLPLLQAELAREPDNIFNLHHLARVLIAIGRPEEAEHALVRAVALARAETDPGVDGTLAWNELVRLRHRRGDDIGSLLAEGLALWPDNWLLVWVEAQVELQASRYEEALRGFERLTRADVSRLADTGVAYDERLFGTFARSSIGLCLFRLGRYTEAADAYAAAELLDPDNLELRAKRGLAEAMAGRIEKQTPTI